MLKNYFLVFIRNYRNKFSYSILNIAGLAVGIACCLLILFWVSDELSYDRFHENSADIYRANLVYSWGEDAGKGPTSPPPLAETLLSEFPQLIDATRIYPPGELIIGQDNQFFNESEILAVDKNFFSFFSLNLIAGDPATCLDGPYKLVLSQSAAEKYFQNEAPIGKTLLVGDEQTAFSVTGIVEDAPHNSHFQYEMLTSIPSHSLVKRFSWSWVWCQLVTYVRLQPGEASENINAQIPALVQKHAGNAFRRIGFPLDKFSAAGNYWQFELQPLTDIHLHSADIGNFIGPLGNIDYVYAFSAIAIFVLLIACINYMNLATAGFANRAREVGIRKVLGAVRGRLIGQFLSEAVLSVALAMLLALGLLELAITPFNEMAGKNLTVNFFDDRWLLPMLLLITIVTGIIAGSYPAFYMTSFNVTAIIKGKIAGSLRSLKMRNVLVICQFTISIALIIGTIVVYTQLNYMRDKDPGFSKENVVVISNAQKVSGQFEAFKSTILKNTNVRSTGILTNAPSQNGFTDIFKPENANVPEIVITSFKADPDVAATLDLEIVAGRNFDYSDAGQAETGYILLNETATREIGWENPIGQHIVYPGSNNGNEKFEIIGIVKDFNFQSYHSPVQPFAILHYNSTAYNLSRSHIVVRIAPGNIDETLRHLETGWQTFVHDAPFEYSFLDADFAALYKSDERFGKIFGIFTTLAIIIASIGLFGLAAFTAEKRTREIGIRKVLGATTAGLVGLLSRDFLKLVAFANLLAWPLAWLAMQYWLENFAYRIELGVGMFFLAGGLAMIIAFAALGVQVLRAALANPIDSLRYE